MISAEEMSYGKGPMAEYRIVRDNYLGYEVQMRLWWWPFWVECDFVNTHSTICKAEAFAQAHAAKKKKKKR